MAQKAEDQDAQFTDVTHGRVASDSQDARLQKTAESSSAVPTQAHTESAELQKHAGAQKPGGIFGAFSAFWRRPQAEATSVNNGASAQPLEQQLPAVQQEEQVSQFPAGATDPALAQPHSTEGEGSQHVTQMSEHVPEHAPEQEPNIVDATAGSGPITNLVHGQLLVHQDPDAVVQQDPAHPVLPPSATAPFATEDTPSHTVTLITRPSRNAVLPQQAFTRSASYTTSQHQLFSLQMSKVEQPAGSLRTLKSARADHAVDSTRFLMQHGMQQLAPQGASVQQAPPFADEYSGAAVSAPDSTDFLARHQATDNTSQPLLPPSATAPFATEDTPSHTVTSITRPARDIRLPQQALIHNASYTTVQQQLLSLPISVADRPEGSIRALNSARMPHPMESISFLQQPQRSALVAASHAAAVMSAEHSMLSCCAVIMSESTTTHVKLVRPVPVLEEIP